MSTQTIKIMRDKKSSAKDLKHELNGRLAVIGSFLAICQQSDFKNELRVLLQNAIESYEETLELLKG